jgi:hypothetical protein
MLTVIVPPTLALQLWAGYHIQHTDAAELPVLA